MTPPQLPTLSTVCPNCGLRDDDRQDFCPQCGEYLRWSDPASPKAAPPPPTMTMTTAPRPQPAPAPAPAPETTAPEPVLLLLDGGSPTVTVAAGQRAALTGLIRNQSGLVDNYDLRVTGLPEEWTAPPPTAYLLPLGSGDGHEQRFEIGLQPPRAPEAHARPWPLTVEAVSRSRGAVVARAQATLVIQPYYELAATASPQRRRSRRGARFAVDVVSRGNAPATLALSAQDAGDACTARFDEPAVRIAPGGRATARLRVRPRRTLWWGRPEEHRVDIAPELAGDPAAAPPPLAVTLRQLPWIPWWVPVALLAAVAIAIALLALRGEQIVVPEVRGETVEVAQQRLVDAGLEAAPRLQEVVVGDAGQVGRVLGQTPAAGDETDSDGAVILQAGVANQVVAVPEIRGATRDQAQQLLQQAGLTLGVIEPGDASGDARVEFQNPGAGGQARLGSPVNVILADEEEAEPEPEQPAEPPAEEVDPAPAEDALQPPA
jgi:PASTA domain-containing protein